MVVVARGEVYPGAANLRKAIAAPDALACAGRGLSPAAHLPLEDNCNAPPLTKWNFNSNHRKWGGKAAQIADGLSVALEGMDASLGNHCHLDVRNTGLPTI